MDSAGGTKPRAGKRSPFLRIIPEVKCVCVSRGLKEASVEGLSSRGHYGREDRSLGSEEKAHDSASNLSAVLAAHLTLSPSHHRTASK